MDFFPVSPGPFLPDITIDKKSNDDLSLNLDIENFPDDLFSKQEKQSLVNKEDSLFDHAQGNDFSMFDNLDSFLAEFGGSSGSSDLDPLSAPSPALSDSGLSNTDSGSSDQMLSPGRPLDDDASGSDTSEPEQERAFSPMDLIKIEPPSPDSTTTTTERVATVCKSVGERTAVPAAPRVITTAASAPASSSAATSAPSGTPAVTVLRQTRPGHSILIPVNIKGSGNIKTVKILSAPNALKRTHNGGTIVGELRPAGTTVRPGGGPPRVVYSVANRGERPAGAAGPVITVCSGRTAAAAAGDHSAADGHKRKLDLTSEERRLLKKEGVLLPTHYPLTRDEERELKRIRRKIRNKMSAQDSRKRKKEYIDGLEDRVRACTTENQDLHKRIRRLETQNTQLSQQNNTLAKQNETLTSQLRRLQAHITRVALGAGRGVAQPSTCLMILLLSLSLCVLPSLKEELKEEAALAATAGADANAAQHRSARTLLSQSAKADFLSLYLNRKPAVGAGGGLAGLDLELSDGEDEPAPAGKRARLSAAATAGWMAALKEEPLDEDGGSTAPPPEPDPTPPATAAAAARNASRHTPPPPARIVINVQRQ